MRRSMKGCPVHGRSARPTASPISTPRLPIAGAYASPSTLRPRTLARPPGVCACSNATPYVPRAMPKDLTAASSARPPPTPSALAAEDQGEDRPVVAVAEFGEQFAVGAAAVEEGAGELLLGAEQIVDAGAHGQPHHVL